MRLWPREGSVGARGGLKRGSMGGVLMVLMGPELVRRGLVVAMLKSGAVILVGRNFRSRGFIC
ncbi:MAG: hypothetical protein IJ228_09025 [Succinivibrio sp.]|nr:hypothetical protein [Succinivibrio sp.]